MKRKEKIIDFNYSKDFHSLLQITANIEVGAVLNPLLISEGFKTLYALGAKNIATGNAGNAFHEIEKLKKNSDQIFGYFSYDLKNEIEALHSNHSAGVNFPDFFFFQPQLIIEISLEKIKVKYFEEDEDFAITFITNVHNKNSLEKQKNTVSLQSKITKEEYINAVNKLKLHIHRGDIYEVNFCMEFFAENAIINTVETYSNLLQKSATPFACFLKINDLHLLCASPERFIKKEGNKVISQPIKGTAKRGATSDEDKTIKNQLYESAKERSENVMIVDLVRNDLSTIANNGTVKVDELFKVHTFAQWHQMISTISCEVRSDVSPLEIIKKCFPMGSMTGAPKVSAMKLIEEYENMKRGIFSGAVGYIDEEENFDFNVVIRSIMYDAQKHKLSMKVGSAITAHCDPEQEFDECLLKAAVLKEVLQ